MYGSTRKEIFCDSQKSSHTGIKLKLFEDVKYLFYVNRNIFGFCNLFIYIL